MKKNYISLVLMLFMVIAGCTPGNGSNPIPELSSSLKAITSFSLNGVVGTINETGKTIAVTMPFGTDVTAMVATFTTNGASVKVGETIQVSGTTVNNFTNQVTYTVTAADATTQDYVVTVTPAAGTKVTFTADGVSFKMAYVPGGLSFPLRNSDSDHATVASAYWIAETVVTYELWYAVKTWAAANNYTFANSGAEGSDGTAGAAPTTNKNQPVTTVNWRDAMVFTNALTEWYNAKNGTNYTCVYYVDSSYTTPIRNVDTVSTVSCCPTGTGCSTSCSTPDGTEDNPYIKADATGFRLLGSNEYELAARYKGSDSTNGAIPYPTGSGYFWTPGNYASGATAYAYDLTGSDNPNLAPTHAVAWFSQSGTEDVGKLVANTLGLYDMSGNVFAWNSDWFAGQIGFGRIMRGSSWFRGAFYTQLGYVFGTNPHNASDEIGFRLSRTDL